MAQQDFTGKFWPIANANASEVVPGAAILQTRNGLDEPITLAGNMVFDSGSGLWVPVSESNPLPTKATLTGSTVPDAQALPMTPAQKDIVARAIDAIIGEIGLDNIAAFVPMWETSGSELRDLIHPSLKFRVQGATPGVVGPFGSAWAFDGVNDYVEEAPAIETAAGSSDAALDSATKMLAQRIKQKQPLRPVAFVRLSLKRVGNPSGNLVVEIREDSGGVPGSTVVATSGTVSAGNLSTGYTAIGFEFDPPQSLRLDLPCWLVLKWQTATTVDASNYVAWSYDTAGAYGEPRATYDGAAWTATSGQSHGFTAYYDHLAIKEGTYIAAFKPALTSPAYKRVVSHGLSDFAFGGRYIRSQSGGVSSERAWQVHDRGVSLTIHFAREINLDRFAVAAMSISTAASTDKLVAYWNGLKVSSASGTGGQASSPPRYPLAIGADVGLRSPGSGAGSGEYFPGHIGAVIVSRTPLTQQQIANVTRHLLALRRYGVSGV